MIKVTNVLDTKIKMLEDKSFTNFEISFIRSITKDKYIYNESKLYGGNILDMSYKKTYLYLSDKQERIYLSIEYKYNNKSINGDIFSKYTIIFKEKGITLDSFDLRHLETFKGTTHESENFKKWVAQIITK